MRPHRLLWLVALLFLYTSCDRFPIVDDESNQIDINDRVRPVVVETTPKEGTTVSCSLQAITATFSESINFTTINSQSFRVSANDTVLEGSYAKNASSISFTPTTAFSCQTLFSVTLSTAIRDLNNNALKTSTTWTFQTNNTLDDTPPTIISYSPEENIQNASKNSTIIVTFSEAIDPSSAHDNFYLLDGKQGVVTGTVLPNSHILTFTPQHALNFDETACSTQNGFKSFNASNKFIGFTMSQDNYIGVKIATDLSEANITIYYPSIPIVIPKRIGNQQIPGYNPGGDIGFAIEFAAEILNESFSYFYAEVEGVCYRASIPNSTSSPSDTRLTAYYTNGFTPVVTTGITDLAGNHLENNFSWQFFTTP